MQGGRSSFRAAARSHRGARAHQRRQLHVGCDQLDAQRLRHQGAGGGDGEKGNGQGVFPNTVGVPDEFSQVESIILDIIPCHLLVEFYFQYLTWLECERVGFTWQSVEDAHHTWESFEKAVPEEE